MIKKLLVVFLINLPLLANADAIQIDGIYYNLHAEVKQAEVTINPNPNKYFFIGDIVYLFMNETNDKENYGYGI